MPDERPQPARVSIVTPVYNEEESLPNFRKELFRVIDSLETHKGDLYSFEVIFVNDGSRDGSWELLKKFCAEDSRIKAVTLTRNFGQQPALEAGLSLATGDAVVTIDCDLEDPPMLIEEMLTRWQAGNEIVVAKRKYTKEKSWFKRITSDLFYKTFNKLCDVELQTGVSEFRLIDREVIEAMKTHFREKELFLRGLLQWMGYQVVVIEYNKGERAHGTSKWPLKRMIRLAWIGISSFSTLPLRLIAISGGLISAISFFLLVCMALARWVFDLVQYQDIAFLVVFIIFSNGLILFAIGVVALYLMQVYRQVQGRPTYIVWKKINFE